MQRISSEFIAPILGALCALAPLSIGAYLPSLPQIAASLNVDEGAVQFSLTAFFAGLTLGQLFYGLLSDRVGRKPAIYVGLALFVVSSIGCAIATTAGQLIGWRFVQGLGGSASMAITFAVMHDLYNRRTAAALLTMMMAELGVMLIGALVIGSAILAVRSWQDLFVLQAVFGEACAMAVAIALPETSPLERHIGNHTINVANNYLRLLVSRRYIPYATATALAQGGFFAYLTGSPFVFMSLHGLTPTAYGAAFALTTASLMAGGQNGLWLMRRLHPQTIVRGALAVYAGVAALLTLLELAGSAEGVFLYVLLFAAIAAMAVAIPPSSKMALDSYGTIMGTTVALMGILQSAAGMFASFAVGITANGTALPMIATMTACGVAACVAAFFAFPKADVTPQKKTAL